MHSFFTIYSPYNLRFIAFIILWPAKPIMSLAAGFKIVLLNVLSNDNVHWLNNDIIDIEISICGPRVFLF